MEYCARKKGCHQIRDNEIIILHIKTLHNIFCYDTAPPHAHLRSLTCDKYSHLLPCQPNNPKSVHIGLFLQIFVNSKWFLNDLSVQT